MKSTISTLMNLYDKAAVVFILLITQAVFSGYAFGQSSAQGRINLGLYGGASLDFAWSPYNNRLFSAVEKPGSLFYTDDSCATWTQAFPVDSLEYNNNRQGWSGGRRVLTNANGWVGVLTSEAGGTLRSSVISYMAGDSGTFKTAFDNYILQQLYPPATGQAPTAIALTDHWFYVGMDNYLLRTNDTATYGSHNIVIDMDTVSIAAGYTSIIWVSAANSVSGYPVLIIAEDSAGIYTRLFSFDGVAVTEISNPVLTSGTTTTDYYFKKVFTHPVDTTLDTLIVSTFDLPANNIEVFRSYDGGTTWSVITPPSGTSWHLQNADYCATWVSAMPVSHGLRISFSGGDYSDDLGDTWSPHVLPDNAVAFSPADPDIMVGSKNAGPRISYDGGSTFTAPANEGHAAVSITKISQKGTKTYYVATKAGLGYTIAYHDSTVNGVERWQPPYGDFPITGVGSYSGVTAVDIDPNDSLHVVVGYSEGFYYSTTGPSGFTQVTPTGWDSGLHHDYTVTDIQFITSDTIVAVTGTGSNVWPTSSVDYGNIWISTDGGASWSKQHPSDAGVDFEQGNAVAVSYTSTDTVIFIGCGYWDHQFPTVNGQLWKSTDFGTTWSYVNTGPASQLTGSTVDSMPIYDLDIYPGSNDTLFFASGENLDYAFAYSTDGGLTYNYVTNIHPEGAFSAVMIHPNNPDIVSVSARRCLWRYDATLGSPTLVFEGLPGEFVPELEYGSVLMGTTTGLYKLSETPGSVLTIWRGVGNWSDVSKWSNGIPYDICEVIIDSGEITADINRDLYRLTVRPGAAMTIDTGFTIAVSGDFILESDKQGDASFIDYGTLNVNGNIKVERYLENSRWYYLTPPVTDATAGVFMGFYLKYWDETINDWVYITNAGDPLLSGKGYASWLPGNNDTTIIYEGTLRTGDYNPVLSLSGDTASGYGWNLIGNGFPSAFDWDDPSVSKTNIDNTVYFWDGTQYLTYNGTTHVGSSGATQYISPQQGFFVHAYDNNPQLTITQASRIHKSQQFLKKINKSVDNLLRIHVTGNNLKDETIILFTEQATNGFDHTYDAYKLQGIEEAPMLYTGSWQYKYAMNVQPLDSPVDAVPLGFKAGTEGVYTLSMEGVGNFPEDLVISLEDKKTNQLINLRTDSVYTFSAVTTDNPERFVLYFDATAMETPELPDNAENLHVYAGKDKTIYLKQLNGTPLLGTLKIYDMMGRLLETENLTGNKIQIIKTGVPAGFYLLVVYLQTENEVITRKIFIK